MTARRTLSVSICLYAYICIYICICGSLRVSSLFGVTWGISFLKNILVYLTSYDLSWYSFRTFSATYECPSYIKTFLSKYFRDRGLVLNVDQYTVCGSLMASSNRERHVITVTP